MSNLPFGIGGFPRTAQVVQAIGVAGDFATANPRFTVASNPNPNAPGFVAGPNGVGTGAFCWADPLNLSISNTGTGLVTGFVGREGQLADIVVYLAYYSNTILSGQPVIPYSGGDFFVLNTGASPTSIGQKAYANFQTGLVTFAASGSPPTSATDSGATLDRIVSASTGGALPTTNTATVSIAAAVGNAFSVMTVSGVGAGSVLAGGVGQTVNGIGIDPATTIIAQLPGGTLGGAGTYSVSVNQVVPAGTAATLSGGGLTLTGANQTGVFAPSMTISGTNVPTGTTILAYGTATAGAAGTYLVDRPATVAATASTVTATNAMLLTVSGASSGTWALNDALFGASVVAQSIVANGVTNPNLTGLGGVGTYLTNVEQSALTAQTISVASGVETKWAAQTVAGPGDLVIMSDHLLG